MRVYKQDPEVIPSEDSFHYEQIHSVQVKQYIIHSPEKDR